MKRTFFTPELTGVTSPGGGSGPKGAKLVDGVERGAFHIPGIGQLGVRVLGL